MKIIELNNDDMPEKLRKIKNPPKKLYAIGNIDLMNRESFAIVGTRRISDYGIKNCKYFTRELACRNIPIVSGLAVGTDTLAHKTTLEQSGETIAVLGSGLKKVFPKENITLFEEIVDKGGLIISEYELNVEATKNNFPKRNRIITALSEGILVIEATYRSGTSITAKHAKEQGKLVFAVPGRIDSKTSVGVNKLIKEGAILTTEIRDILEHYPNFNSKTVKIRKTCKNEEYEKIINILEEGEKSIQEIVNLSNIDISKIFEILVKMELENIIMKDYFGKYALI